MSSKTSCGLNLSDTLLTGPVLQNDFRLRIVRWCFYRYVFNGDIEKIYQQILLDAGQLKYQRVISSESDKEVENFKLKIFTIGVNCAHFLAIRTLLQFADDGDSK